MAKTYSYMIRCDILPSSEHEFVSWGSHWSTEEYMAGELPSYAVGRGVSVLLEPGCFYCDSPSPPYYEPAEYEQLIAKPKMKVWGKGYVGLPRIPLRRQCRRSNKQVIGVSEG
jgi:hypothetical protein